jgi:PhzF family phenazine biosynthesis protein
MRIRVVDSFTDRPFAGNPAGVVLLDADSFPDAGWLSRVAAEVNHSETAFAHPLPAGGEADWALRWFTPVTEVTLCGHATLAVAHVLHTTGTTTATVRFATHSGILSATADADGSITLDFPTATLTAVEESGPVDKALGVDVISLHDTGPNTGDLLAHLKDETTVRTLAPDLAAIAAITCRGVIVTALADDATGGYDFVSRMFAPAEGIDEDPVTGSAHTALAPFWSDRLGRTELIGFQASARGGFVRTVLQGERTLLIGRAVTVLDGELLP